MDHFQAHAPCVGRSSDNIQQADVDWPGANESSTTRTIDSTDNDGWGLLERWFDEPLANQSQGMIQNVSHTSQPSVQGWNPYATSTPPDFQAYLTSSSPTNPTSSVYTSPSFFSTSTSPFDTPPSGSTSMLTPLWSEGYGNFDQGGSFGAIPHQPPFHSPSPESLQQERGAAVPSFGPSATSGVGHSGQQLSKTYPGYQSQVPWSDIVSEGQAQQIQSDFRFLSRTSNHQGVHADTQSYQKAPAAQVTSDRRRSQKRVRSDDDEDEDEDSVRPSGKRSRHSGRNRSQNEVFTDSDTAGSEICHIIHEDGRYCGYLFSADGSDRSKHLQDHVEAQIDARVLQFSADEKLVKARIHLQCRWHENRPSRCKPYFTGDRSLCRHYDRHLPPQERCPYCNKAFSKARIDCLNVHKRECYSTKVQQEKVAECRKGEQTSK
ncbi:hypothetical protein F5051DRAFT_432929 [Lentinula edodes]|nr:hypothetical protein F5051DRAFT_432929 [Lentinula edodes]